MRIVTFGNPDHPFMPAAVAAITDAGMERAGWVLSQGGKVDPNSEECRTYLKALEPDLFLAVGYGQILGDETLAIPSVGSLNVHPSLLPRYRGIHTIYWALYEGATETGVTVHEMTSKVDGGPILAQGRLALRPDDTIASVYERMAPLAGSALHRALEGVARAGMIQGRPQEGESSYRGTLWRDYVHQEADWSLPARELVRRSRLANGRMNVRAGARRIFFKSMAEAGTTAKPPGTILRLGPASWTVATGDGTVVRVALERPARAWAKLFLARVRRPHSAEPREMVRGVACDAVVEDVRALPGRPSKPA